MRGSRRPQALANGAARPSSPRSRRPGARPRFLGFERVLCDERILVVFNLSDQPARLALEPFGAVRPLSGHGFGAVLQRGAALLPPYGAFFAALEAATIARPGRELERVGG